MSLKPRDILIYFSIKYHGDWSEIFSAIKRKEEINEDEANETISKLNCKVITLLDDEYPINLKNMFKPPFVLYYFGDIGLLKGYSKNLAVIGAREPTDYAIENCKRIIKEIALDYLIVSGCALGIDGIAQQTCIDNGGRTIGVLGCGVDVVFPITNTKLIKEIAKNHLLISEYPPGTKPERSYFIARNRIVVGLTLNVLAFDVKKESGSQSSTTFAIQNNRNIMSIPYPAGSPFLNNTFLKEGAYMIESGEDIRFLLERF